MSTIGIAKDLVKLAGGAAVFSVTGRTPPASYQSLISLFARTGGRSNDLLAKAIGAIHAAKAPEPATGVLGTLSPDETESLAQDLRRDGYKLFPGQLDAAVVDRLLAFALREPCVPRAKDTDNDQTVKNAAPFPRQDPRAIVYDFGPDLLVNDPDVQQLMTDPTLYAVAQAYIGAMPVLDEVNMWWTTSAGTRADSGAAQLYHFDMDRIRWLKVFIYLTDVTEANGPHCFVAGSHRTGGIPQSLLAKGYARHTDAEVRAAYQVDQIKSFVGPKGTILLEDTRGLHKGAPAISGDRLMLEFEFSSSMFGGMPVMDGHVRAYASEHVRSWVQSHKRTYQRWCR